MTEFDNFKYQNGKLFCEGTDVEIIAKKQGTPLYVYSYKSLVDQFGKLDRAFSAVDHLVCFSVKANPNKAILRAFFAMGAGADVVSGGELRRAVAAGCDPKKIVFSGVGKTSEEIHLALGEGILQFNVESEQELANIQRIANFLDKRAKIAIRVNPDVDAKTHPYISTGLKCNKFGVSHKLALDLYKKARDMSHIDIAGIDCHIGSQLLDLEPFTDAMLKVRELVLSLKANGIALESIDVGGGLGIRYKDESAKTADEYARAILAPLQDLGIKIILEPGRFLVGNAGIFVSKVVYLKKNEEGKHFTIVDGAFNDLMRPMLYGAYHEINPVVEVAGRPQVVTDVVGPICETTDSFAKDRTLPLVGPGEYVAFMSAGAYGASMASLYNSRGRPTEVLVKDKEFFVIKKPDRLEDITEREAVPEFLKERE